ncbi:aromatic acid exporter family protein [Cohnella sp. CFH 77786]|uniref:aromatic acid exporter family protein n=1 Tax=Cohnella sp. CFH 77786 TaxID=2662265 RepID=UPI001C60D959|nr:aromatic acid exporter family protein [Cohnella sp. CFH 77786]MBW5446535.1 aromatic acid exporter family protein [Cohnella sp. CFH 77786]
MRPEKVWGSIRSYFGFRVIKTAAAALAAILTATFAGADNPLSAGLLAILGVETTRWKGLRIVFARFAASLLGLLLAMALFRLIGFHIWVLSIYILIAFPLLGRFGLKDGIVTGSVVVFHLFSKREVSPDALVAELQLLLIGLGWATAFNLAYMPKEGKKLTALRDRTEDSLAAIFVQLARHLRDPETLWAGEELIAAEDAIERGIVLSDRARENRLIPQDEPWQLYFHMRREQLDSVKLMMESVAFVSSKVPQAEMIAGLFDRLSQDVKSEFYEGETERKLGVLEESFRRMPLPATREEFETRAALLQLSRELKRCLQIAKRSKKRKSSSDPAVIE